jgi:CoA:oxalate CoA-transferase
MIDAFRPNPLCELCAVLGLEDLPLDPRFADNASPIQHGEAVKVLPADGFRDRTTAQWLRELGPIDFLCCAVYSREDAFRDEQVRHNQMVIEFDHPQGRLRAIGSPVKLVDTPAHCAHPRPGWTNTTTRFSSS